MAQVKLILLDDVENLGLAGDEVTVSPGYARNYLLPRGLASKATPGIMRIVESRKAQIAARRAQELADAQALAAKLAEVEISIAMQATEDDQLFGSVTVINSKENLSKEPLSVSVAKNPSQSLCEEPLSVGFTDSSPLRASQEGEPRDGK